MSLVGREPELAWLHAGLDLALTRQTQVRFVTGSAGTGKSSLIEEFASAAREKYPNLVVVAAQCNAHTGPSDPYLPFLSVLEQLTASYQADAARGQTALSSASARLQSLARVSAEALVQYAPELVGTLIPGSSAIVGALRFAAKQAGWLDKLSAVERKASESHASLPGATDQARIVQQYTAAISALAAHHPLVLILDDLQWIDSASCDLLFHLALRVRTNPILIAGLFRHNDLEFGRAGERHPLTTLLAEAKRHQGSVILELDQLSAERGRSFVTGLVNREAHRLPPGFVEQFYHITGGHALFCTELLSHLRESGDLVRDGEGFWTAAPSLDWSRIPARVEGVIEERIARLEGELRELLTLASVEGESFTVQVLAGLQKKEERALLKALSGELEKCHRLIAESGAERIGRNWIARYLFSNVLFQQYLYRELSHRERMLLHGDVANQLEEIYKGQTEKITLQLARHFRLAGDEEKAVRYLLQASRRALRACAYSEARMQLEEALVLVSEAPDDDQRRADELEILVALGACLKAIRGWNAPEVISVYGRARELCKTFADPPRLLAPVLLGMWAIKLLNVELSAALAMAEEALALAKALSDAGIAVQARVAIANTCFWSGEFTAAIAALQDVSQLLDPTIRQTALVEWGQDPAALAGMFETMLASVTGRAAEAIALRDATLRSIESMNHPFSLAIAVQAAAWVSYHLEDRLATREFSEKLVKLAGENEFPFYHGIGLMFLGWARAGDETGTDQEIEEGYRNGVAASGSRLVHSLYSLLKADCLRAQRKLGAAFETVELGIKTAVQNGELAYISELHRLRAELLLELNPEDSLAAEEACLEALAIARNQKAALFAERSSAVLDRLHAVRDRQSQESAGVKA